MGEWWERHRIAVGVAPVAAALGAFLALLLARPEPPPVRIIEPTRVPTPSEVVVHVAGAVEKPGVYRLPTTARVLDGLDAAGGATANGNPHVLNLAAPLRDGEQIVVPEVGETVVRAAGQAGQLTPVRIDLNTADQAQLESLPGIGPVTAQRILQYRAREGRFQDVAELLEARLVNRSTFEQIQDLVTAR